ncbi:hypothetical protein XF24_00265 [candidate division SR1 bacterium Aalborg_AAW-1]|nr:hypothetical protein XF24_00265 [candidate division SR1 bacterium Aalborg_AAW-1]
MDNTNQELILNTTQDNPVTIINNITIRDNSEDFSATGGNKNIDNNLLQTDNQKEQAEVNGTEELGNLNKDIVIQKFQDETTDYRANMTNINPLSESEINKQNNDLLITKTNKEQAIATALSGTTHELLNSKQETIEMTVSQIKQQIHDLKQQVRFAARGEGKDVREVKRYIIDWLNLAEKRINKYQRATKRFGTEVVKDSHEAAMYAKIATLLSNSKDYVSQAITGDINEAKKFFPPNVFEDGSPYIPDKSPSKDIYNQQIHPAWINNLSPAEQRAYVQCVEGSGSKNSGIKKLGSLIDTKMHPWLLENGFNQQGANITSGAMKLGLLVVNGVTLWNMGKNVFHMVFGGDKKKGEYFRNFLINAGIFGGLNFIDPEKALGKLKETRGWVTGQEGNTTVGFDKSGNPDFSAALIALQNNNISNDEKIQIHGPLVVGGGLIGLNYREAAQNNIFQTNGNQITGVNIDNLKAFYNEKYASKSELRNKFIEYANNLEKVQQSDPKMISTIMKQQYITTQNLQNPEFADTIIGTHISQKLNEAKIATNTITDRNTLDTAVKKSSPTIVQEIGDTSYNILIEATLKLPDSIKKEIAAGTIEFKVINGKLIMQAHGEQAGLDINKHTLSLFNKSGNLSEFPNGTKDTTELLNLAYIMTREIQEHKGKFMIDNPMFYSKPYGEWGHKINATLGGREWLKPGTWVSGRSVTVLDGSWLFGDTGLSKFKEDNVMEQFADYLNKLGIWKGDNADHYINTTLKQRLKEQYPDLTDIERQQLLNDMLGIIPNRGSIEPLIHSGTEYVSGKVEGVYTYLRDDIFGAGWDKVKELYKGVVKRSIKGGVLMVELADGTVQNFWEGLQTIYPTDVVKRIQTKYNARSKTQLQETKNIANKVSDYVLGELLFGPQQ